MSAGFDVQPVAGALGAEIAGVDLSRPLSDTTYAGLRRAWLEHLVLFFRDQELTPAQFLAFGRRFGEVIEYPFVKGLDDYPEIIPVLKLAHEHVNFGGVWHSDTAYLEAPPMASMLVAREIPPVGGDTLFASMYLAYETLSDGMKRLIEPLVAINSSSKADASRTREDRMKDSGREGRKEYVSAHPVVRRHPETGRRAVRQRRAHRALRRDDGRGERAAARVSVPPPDPTGVHVPLPLAPGLTGDVGQPLRPAQRHQRLSRSPAAASPDHARRRHAERSVAPDGQRSVHELGVDLRVVEARHPAHVETEGARPA